METQDICPVCMENREEIKCNAIVLNCSHFVCIDCITQLLKYRITTCPLCRIDFIKCLTNIVDVDADVGAEESDQGAEESDQGAEESDQGAEESDQGAEESDQGAEESDQDTEESDQDAEILSGEEVGERYQYDIENNYAGGSSVERNFVLQPLALDNQGVVGRHSRPQRVRRPASANKSKSKYGQSG